MHIVVRLCLLNFQCHIFVSIFALVLIVQLSQLFDVLLVQLVDVLLAGVGILHHLDGRTNWVKRSDCLHFGHQCKHEHTTYRQW